MKLSQGYLRAILDYNPETGVFTWAVDRAGTAHAGTVAGSLNKGYIIIRIDYKPYSAHRLAWLYVHGEWPPEEIDHINGVKNDNRVENLRLANRYINNQNQSLRKDNNSGEVGVFWRKDRLQWVAQIKVNKKKIHLGYFNDKMEAIYERRKASQIHGFHENHGRAA